MATQGFTGYINTKEEAHHRLLPDPALLWVIFRRRLGVFLGVAAFVLSAVAAAVVFTPRLYEATASVLIEPRKADPTGTAAVVPGLPADTYVVDTQTRLMGGSAVALRVVRELHLDSDPAYVGDEREKSVRKLDSTDATPAESKAVKALLRNASVRRSGLTYVIDVAVRARSPQLAADIANSFARNYIAMGSTEKRNTTEEAASFVQENADHLREQALKDDEAVQNYMIAHNLMSADGATLAERQISDLTGQIAQAHANLAQELGRYNAAREQVGRGGGADVNAVLSSETIRQLRTQEAQVSGQLATLQARYGDLYPDVISAKNNLTDIRRHIADERDRILSGLRANVEVAQSGLASLEASYNKLHGSLAANNSAMVGLLDLQRKADASKQVYTAFLERAKETAAQAQSATPDASVSAIARPSETPIWPNYPLALLFGGLVSVTAGILGIAAAEYLDGTIHSRSDMERHVGLSYAGAIPDLRKSGNSGGLDPMDYALARPHSRFAEALRNVEAFLTLRGAQSARVVAIASSFPGEGKTTLAVCLARSLARSGRRVVLVDGDLRRHYASTLLVPGIAGRLSSALDGRDNPSDLLVQDRATGLYVLPSSGNTGMATQLTLEAMTRLFDALKRDFDLVIVDTAPVLGLAETRVMARAADAVLLVTRWRKTSAKAAQAAIHILRECHANVIGGILSMVNSRQFAIVNQGDSYSYHRKFNKYYSN